MHKLPVLLLLMALAGCSESGEEGVAATPATVTATATGTFAAYTPGAMAVTYEQALAPAGSSATVTVGSAGTGTRVQLTATGLLANRRYGAHLHVRPCGSTGAAAGPHFQHQPDPAASASPPSVDPSYANPANEVWLDFATDAAGAGSATANQPWPWPTSDPPRSLVIHAASTETAPGRAGTAGARVACLTLPA